ncbi:hypothetical protein [Nitrosomonas sp.]|uniref:hypothetical protein n=1 Tax=Nitrosomonas sp. TaxID=42353 RepID=UPI002730794C|nr:hypothetical protein [Nitrosomonas sp.]MDP2223726.1 hypothetical protein [Nitrosomonas sp.]
MSEYNNPIGESTKRTPITAYLTYRKKNPQNAAAPELLENIARIKILNKLMTNRKLNQVKASRLFCALIQI